VAGTEIEHTAGDHGTVAHHEAPSYNPDAPSEEWGWHGHWADFAPRGKFLLLGLGVAGLLLMLLGNQQSHVEDWFLVIIAFLLAAWMTYSYVQHRKQRRIKP
jgi:hypothetical protein